MEEQGRKDHTGEWIALILLAIVGGIMLVMLYVRDAQAYMNLVPAIVSSLLFMPAVWLVVQIRRTGAYLLALPLLLSSLMAVITSFSGVSPVEQLEKRLDARVSAIQSSTKILANEMGKLRVTVHEGLFKSHLHPDDGFDNIPPEKTNEIPGTGSGDACFISSLYWQRDGKIGRFLVTLIPPVDGDPWRIALLNSVHKRNDSVHARVMCIGLPAPGQLQKIDQGKTK